MFVPQHPSGRPSRRSLEIGGNYGRDNRRTAPGVVLRSQFDHLRALVAIALVAVVGLTVAVVVVATDEDGAASPSAAEPIESSRGHLPAQLGRTRDEPGTHGPLPARLPNTGDEPGTHGPLPARLPNTGDEPGTHGPLPARLPNGS
jgi:hypothetical protein